MVRSEWSVFMNGRSCRLLNFTILPVLVTVLVSERKDVVI